MSTVAAATESKLLKRDSMLNDLEDLDPGTLNKVNDFVDDDLLSCFLWAAGENARGASRALGSKVSGTTLRAALYYPLPGGAIKRKERLLAAFDCLVEVLIAACVPDRPRDPLPSNVFLRFRHPRE